MRFAADLHLHSCFAGGVSPAMTLENIALWAQRKGVDLLGTGDCLQPQWLEQLEAGMIEAEPGFYALEPEIERAVHARLPEGLRRSLRFVLSTEVNCAAGVSEMNGIHQLIYFPSIAEARKFAARIGKKGDLQEGRPTLAVSCRDLVRGAKEFDRVRVAAPHVMNPWFSVLGVIGGRLAPEEIYGDQLPDLWAVETGLTSNPPMCRRVPGLDHQALYACSDAHSLENIGRECTLLEIEPGYDALMNALRDGANQGLLKFPIELTRYFLNWCSKCQASFDDWPVCPQCGARLTIGSRDHLEQLAGVRVQPKFPVNVPPFEALKPLAYVIADVTGKKPDSPVARREAEMIIDRSGLHERAVLTEADAPQLLAVTTPEITSAILRQRTGAISRPAKPGEGHLGQASLWT